MRRILALAVMAIAWVGLSTPARGEGAEVDMAGMKDAEGDLAAGKYADCLQKLAKLLAHTSALEKSAERGKLLSLKGECLLQQKQAPAAADAFDGARSAFPPKDGKDAKEAAVSAATGLLIKKSTDFQYTPRTAADKTALPILDISGRHTAFAALFTDELAEAQEEITPLMKPNVTLQSVIDFSIKLHQLGNVEIAATGANTQTAVMAKDLATAAKKDLDNALAQMNKTTDGIDKAAATTVTVVSGSGKNRKETQRPRGITGVEHANLSEMLATVKKIPAAVKTLESDLGTEADYFKQEEEDSKTLKPKIEAILKQNKING